MASVKDRGDLQKAFSPRSEVTGLLSDSRSGRGEFELSA